MKFMLFRTILMINRHGGRNQPASQIDQLASLHGGRQGGILGRAGGSWVLGRAGGNWVIIIFPLFL